MASVRIDLTEKETASIDRLAKKNKRTRKAQTHELVSNALKQEESKK